MGCSTADSLIPLVLQNSVILPKVCDPPSPLPWRRQSVPISCPSFLVPSVYSQHSDPLKTCQTTSPLKQSQSPRVLRRVQPPAHPTSGLLSALMPVPLSPLPQLQPKASAAGGTARHSHTCSSAPGLPPGSPQQETGCPSPLRRESAQLRQVSNPSPSGHSQALLFLLSLRAQLPSNSDIVSLPVLLTDHPLTEHKL